MEIKNLNDDIKVFYVQAESFPEGIKAAHEKLHSLLHSDDGRRFFGISYQGSNGNIIYKAAAEELFEGEAEKYNCDTFTIKKGIYLSETLHDWQNDESKVTKTFQKMLSDSRLDKNGYCLEMYPNADDMICMVKLDSSKVNNNEHQ